MTTRTAAAKNAKEAEATAENATRATGLRMEGFVKDSQQSMTAQFEKFSKSLEGMSAMGQTNMDALVKSSEIAARAAEGIGSEMSAYSKKAFEDGVAAAQDLAQAKSVTELFEKQTGFAQSAFDGWMQQSSKMSEICVAAAKDISAPFASSMTSAADRMKTASL